MQKRGVGQLNVGNKIGHLAGREAPDQDLFVRVQIAVVVGRVDAGGGESGRGLKGRPGRLGLRGFGRFVGAGVFPQALRHSMPDARAKNARTLSERIICISSLEPVYAAHFSARG